MTVFAFWFDSNKGQHYPFLGTRVIRRSRFFNDIHDRVNSYIGTTIVVPDKFQTTVLITICIKHVKQVLSTMLEICACVGEGGEGDREGSCYACPNAVISEINFTRPILKMAFLATMDPRQTASFSCCCWVKVTVEYTKSHFEQTANNVCWPMWKEKWKEY